MNKIKQISILVGVLSLAACQTVTNENPIKETNKEVNSQKQAEKPIAPVANNVVTVSPAVSALLEKAKQQESENNRSAAISSLERAIRISPRYAESYYLLGEIRYKEENYHQAKALGQKALSLGASGKLRKQSLQLIESASR